eukprot:gene14836-16376_t
MSSNIDDNRLKFALREDKQIQFICDVEDIERRSHHRCCYSLLLFVYGGDDDDDNEQENVDVMLDCMTAGLCSEQATFMQEENKRVRSFFFVFFFCIGKDAGENVADSDDSDTNKDGGGGAGDDGGSAGDNVCMKVYCERPWSHSLERRRSVEEVMQFNQISVADGMDVVGAMTRARELSCVPWYLTVHMMECCSDHMKRLREVFPGFA